jgi:hypothetical protein
MREPVQLITRQTHLLPGAAGDDELVSTSAIIHPPTAHVQGQVTRHPEPYTVAS